MAAPLMLRRALLVLDMQNEFLAPTGRCKVTNRPTPDDVPPFVDNILRFVTAFRQTGKGDVIWVRTEFEQPRDVNDEKVWLYAEEEDEDEDDKDKDKDNCKDKKSKKNTDGDADETNREDRIGKFDEFLSCATNPYCAKGTTAAEFHESVVGTTKTAGDRILKKTWYSAFKNTGLVEILRGRLATELYVCGLKTNTSVYATVSDAVRHGFQVTLLSDCLGFSDQKLHDVALSEMSGVLGCEVIRSIIMVRSWAAKSKPARGKSATQTTTTTKEDLTKMIEKLTLNGDSKNNEDNPEAEPAEPPDTTKNIRDVKDSQKHKVKSQPKERRDGTSPVVRVESVSRAPSDTPPSRATPPSGRNDRSPETSQKQTYNSPVRNPNIDEGRPMRKMRNVPTVLKEGDVMGEGDTKLVNGILPPELCDVVFERLRREVRWRTMLHRGGEVPRLVAVEGSVDEDGSFPIYRHPADESPPLLPFSPTVSIIRDHVQKVINHPVNHVLIQYYRGGNDYISEHSDKTLDIVRGSYIVNVSLGAQRTMILRTKKDSTEWMERDKGKEESSGRDSRQDGKQPGPPRTAQRIPLPHNSMFILGEATNRKWLHAIKQDKRLPTLLSPEEASYGGERISLTFRHIGTFLTDNETKIWGHGATSKKREEAKPVIENSQQEVDRMIYAFGTENHQAEEFDWDGVYGGGFDALHFKNRLPKLYYRSQTSIGATRVLLALSEKGVDVEVEEGERKAETTVDGKVVDIGDEDDISLVDCDIDRTTIKGSIPILLYLETFYTGDKALGGIGSHLFPRPQRHERGPYAQALGLLLESEKLREAYEGYRRSTHKTTSVSSPLEESTESSKPSSSEPSAKDPPKSDPPPQLLQNAARTHLQEALDNFQSHLYRISLGPSGRALGLTKGEEDVCFGGLGVKKSWSIADCAIWPILRAVETWLPDGEAWNQLGHDGRWVELRTYYKRGWEKSRVRRVFGGLNKTGEEKNEKEEEELSPKPGTHVVVKKELLTPDVLKAQRVEINIQEGDAEKVETETVGENKVDGGNTDKKHLDGEKVVGEKVGEEKVDEKKDDVKLDEENVNQETERVSEEKVKQEKVKEEKVKEEKVKEEKVVEEEVKEERVEEKVDENKDRKDITGKKVEEKKVDEEGVEEKFEEEKVEEGKAEEGKAEVHEKKVNAEKADEEDTGAKVIDEKSVDGAAEDGSTQK